MTGTLSGGTGGDSFTSVSGTGTWSASSGTSTVSGNITVTSFTANGGTVALTGSAPQTVNGYTFANLVINDPGQTVTSGGAWTVTGTLTMTAGAWDASTFSHTIAGPWNSSAAGFTFTPNSSTITLSPTVNPNITLKAGQSFNNLVVSAGGTMQSQLTVGGTFAVTGTLTTNGQNLTVTSAATTVNTGGTIAGGAGTMDFGGAVTITGTGAINGAAGAITFSGSVSGTGTLQESSTTTNLAGNLTVTTFAANGGTLVLNGAAAQAVNGYTFNNLTINDPGQTVTSGGGWTVGGALTMTAGGWDASTFTHNIAGSFDSTAAGFAFTPTSSTIAFTSTGTITTKPADSFNNLTINSSGTLTQGSNLVVTNTLAIAAGTLDASGSNFNITLTTGNWVNSGGTFTPRGGTVTFNSAAAQSVTSGGSSFNNLTITGGTALSTTDALSANGTLTISAATDSLNVGGNAFSINALSFNGANGTFLLTGTQAAGSQSITTFDSTNGTVEYTATANGYIQMANPSAVNSTFYNLLINNPGGTTWLNANITVKENLVIAAGTLDANTGPSYSITLGHNWNQLGGPYGTFNAETGTVTLDGTVNSALSAPFTYTIAGSNGFYALVCDSTVTAQNAGATIDIEASQTLTLLGGGGYMNIQGTSGSHITIQSTASPTQWNFNMMAGSSFNLLNYVDVNDSNATPNNVVVPPNVTTTNCTNWLTTIPVAASWAIDANNDGKIDGIVVQASAAVDDNFSGFSVSVTGYTVTGFTTLIPGYTCAPQPACQQQDAYFEITLAPGSKLDTDATPGWTITSNTSLHDQSTGYQLLGPPGAPQTTDDIAPPILAYTLAVTGKSQMYVAFSEPVIGSGVGGALTPADFSNTLSNGAAITGVTAVTTSGGGTKDALLTLGQAVTVTDVLTPVTVTVTASIVDLATPSATAPPTGLTNGPNAIPAALRTHRITDVGLGIPGNEIIAPLWAKDQSQIDPLRGGAGVIHRFDGSAFLQPQEITLQSLITSSYATPGSLSITVKFDAGVAGSLKRGKLWLPPFTTTDYNGLVPYADSAAHTVTAVADMPNAWLRDTVFPSTDSLIVSGNTIEFFYEIAGAIPLLCANLPNPNASNWYDSIQPWAFKLQSIVTQRGNVSILSNVINPNSGDKTNLVYTLTQGGMVTINVFNLAGDLVTTLFRGQRSPGQYSTSWDGRNFTGQAVARGIYFIRVVAPGMDEYRKVLVVK